MQQTSAATQRNSQLDGLRGYAALAVVVFHSILGLDDTLAQRVLHPSFREVHGFHDLITKTVLALFGGDSAVILFFIMSGAVLFASLVREDAPAGRAAFNFAVRRVLRIYPSLIAFLILATAVYPLFGRRASVDLALINLSLYDWPLNGPSWTLQVEMLAAPYIFLCYLCYRRFGFAGLLPALAAGWLIKTPLFANTLIYLKLMLLCFALGMLIPTRIGETVARWLPTWSWLIFLPVLLFARHAQLIGGDNTAAKIQQISAALLVTQIYYGRAGLLGTALGKPMSVFFGRISYTLYLFNVFYMHIIEEWQKEQPWLAAHPLEVGLLTSVLIIALTIPTAYLVTIWIEEPAIRLGRRLTSSRVAPRTTPLPASTPSLNRAER